MDDDRYARLRGELDAAQVVLKTLLQHVSFEEGGEESFKAEIRRYADGMRRDARDNLMSIAQADAMDGYIGRMPPHLTTTAEG